MGEAVKGVKNERIIVTIFNFSTKKKNIKTNTIQNIKTNEAQDFNY